MDYAQQGGKIVRLKSGDPGIFGRLEEKSKRWKRLAFAEIIPGVTSANSAAAAASIPLTRRLNARRLQFVTGHDIAGTLPGLNMAALADPECTTVIYMPKRTFPALAKRLMEQGLSQDTPALLAESVSQLGQKLTNRPFMTLHVNLKKIRNGSRFDPQVLWRFGHKI